MAKHQKTFPRQALLLFRLVRRRSTCETFVIIVIHMGNHVSQRSANAVLEQISVIHCPPNNFSIAVRRSSAGAPHRSQLSWATFLSRRSWHGHTSYRHSTLSLAISGGVMHRPRLLLQCSPLFAFTFPQKTVLRWHSCHHETDRFSPTIDLPALNHSQCEG